MSSSKKEDIASRRGLVKYMAREAIKNDFIKDCMILILFTIFIAIFCFALSLGETIDVATPLFFKTICTFVASLVIVPMFYGLSNYFLSSWRKERTRLGNLFSSFREYYFRNFFAFLFKYLLVAILLGFPLLLKFCLLKFLSIEVPKIILFLLYVIGIVLSINFLIGTSLLTFRVHETYHGPVEVIKETLEITKGHRFELFVNFIYFIPWIILGIVTIGLGFLYTVPYMYGTYAGYYDQLSDIWYKRGR